MSAKFPRGGGGGAGPFLARSLQGDSNSEVIICFVLNFEIYNGFVIYLTSLA